MWDQLDDISFQWQASPAVAEVASPTPGSSRGPAAGASGSGVGAAAVGPSSDDGETTSPRSPTVDREDRGEGK